MPLRELYAMVLEHDIKVGNLASETVGLLQQKEFYQVPRSPDPGTRQGVCPGPRGWRGSEEETRAKLREEEASGKG